MDRSRHDRFTNQAPAAGEFAAGVVLAGSFLVLMTPLVAQGGVAWATSGDFAWPGNLVDGYGTLLQGHFGGGLRQRTADSLPSDAVMWVVIVICEVLVLGSAVVLGVWVRDLTGAGSRHGLATSVQAAEALGMPRLRKSAAVVRPDLYARAARSKGSP